MNIFFKKSIGILTTLIIFFLSLFFIKTWRGSSIPLPELFGLDAIKWCSAKQALVGVCFVYLIVESLADTNTIK